METQRLVEERQGDIERRLPFFPHADITSRPACYQWAWNWLAGSR
jgi:hypothetical protein